MNTNKTQSEQVNPALSKGAVSGWAFHKLKQNDWNIDMYIITTGIIYTILSYLEEWLQDNR